MVEKKPDPFVDELLEASLARLRHAEPRPGVDERLLAGLRASPHGLAWPRWAWLAVGCAALAAIGFAVIPLLRRPGGIEPTPSGRTAQASTHTSDFASPAGTAGRVSPGESARPTRGTLSSKVRAPSESARAIVARSAPPRMSAGITPSTPRPEQFPTPFALTDQERLLIRYLKGNPGPLLAALQGGQNLARELQVKNLEIPRLEIQVLSEPADGESR